MTISTVIIVNEKGIPASNTDRGHRKLDGTLFDAGGGEIGLITCDEDSIRTKPFVL